MGRIEKGKVNIRRARNRVDDMATLLDVVLIVVRVRPRTLSITSVSLDGLAIRAVRNLGIRGVAVGVWPGTLGILGVSVERGTTVVAITNLGVIRVDVGLRPGTLGVVFVGEDGLVVGWR